MTLSKRIISRLDVKGSKLIKGIRFEGLRVIGDLFEAALENYTAGVDEILYIDTVARRTTAVDLASTYYSAAVDTTAVVPVHYPIYTRILRYIQYR